jgi:hypothetical protein
MIKRVLAGTLVTGALTLALVSPAAAANRAGNTLVNVQVSDLTILVPISVAANICDTTVNILANNIDGVTPVCTATADSAASPGNGGGGGGNTAGDSLVNVQLDDIFVAVPVGVALNLCDTSVNLLSTQVETGMLTCDATSRVVAG